MNVISGAVSPPGNLTGSLSPVGGLSGVLTIPERITPDYYDGEYTITPAAEAQTISVRELIMRQDLTVEAIPQNYGLITWNGAYLTIS